MKLLISEIQIGERRRGDMGDIQGLAESIQKFGLLHPVVVDDQKRLAAGGRRLEACKLLGWEEVPATFLGELTDKQLREIELEENIRRLDLSDYEMSKNMAELASLVRQQAQDELCVQGTRNSEPGRPKQPGSYRDIEARTGIPEGTIRQAERHVQAVEKYPTLETLPKKDAIHTAKRLDALPPEEKLTVLNIIKADKPEPEIPGTPEDEEQARQLKRAQNFKTNVDRMIDNLFTASKKPAHIYFDGLHEVEWAFSKVGVFAQNRLEMIDHSIEWLKDFRNEYARQIVNQPEQQGIRRVK